MLPSKAPANKKYWLEILAKPLTLLKQGTIMVAQYATKLCTLTSDLAWNNVALVLALSEGLSGYINDRLVGWDIPSALDDLISLMTRVDLCFLGNL